MGHLDLYFFSLFPFTLPLTPANTCTTFVPTGLPNPVQASHPGPAEYAPLFPDVISRNAAFAPLA